MDEINKSSAELDAEFGDKFVRLYNKKGEHVVSVIPCDTRGCDIATPDGKVLYCGVDYDILRTLLELFGSDN